MTDMKSTDEATINPRGMFGYRLVEREDVHGRAYYDHVPLLPCGHRSDLPEVMCAECSKEVCRAAIRAGARPIAVDFRVVRIGESVPEAPKASNESAAIASLADAVRALADAVSATVRR